MVIGVSGTVAEQPSHCVGDGNGGRSLTRRNMRDGGKNGAVNMGWGFECTRGLRGER